MDGVAAIIGSLHIGINGKHRRLGKKSEYLIEKVHLPGESVEQKCLPQ
jgi:hypothetical protein